jgi:hypothetical protein
MEICITLILKEARGFDRSFSTNVSSLFGIRMRTGF